MWNRKQIISGTAMFVVAVAFFVFSSAASAQALTWGGIVSGMPSCVSRSELTSEDLVCVTLGTDNDLYSIRINPRTGAADGFWNIGPLRSLVGNPSCVASSAPFVSCAVRGELNELYGIIFDAVTLENTGLVRLDQSGEYRPLAGDPSCVNSGPVIFLIKRRPPRVSCGVRGTDNRLHVASFLGNAQGISQSLMEQADPDEVIVGDPSCAVAGGSFVVCLARRTDSSLAIIGWSPILGSIFGFPNPIGNGTEFHVNSLAGPTPFALGNPSCASTRVKSQFIAAGGSVFVSGSVFCAIRGTDSALYLTRLGHDQNGVFASTYQSLGGILTNDPSCASTRSRVVTCGVRGTDGYLYMIDIDTETGSRSTYQQQPMVIPGDAVCVSFSYRVELSFADQPDFERNVACAVLDLKNGLATVASVRPSLTQP